MLGQREPEIRADITLLTTQEGGLHEPIYREKIGCILTYKGEDFSCVLFLPSGTKVFPGDTARLQIQLLHPEVILHEMKPGDEIFLRDYRVFGRGEVVEIVGR